MRFRTSLLVPPALSDFSGCNRTPLTGGGCENCPGATTWRPTPGRENLARAARCGNVNQRRIHNMIIHLPADLESLIRAEVMSGHFASEDDMVATAVRDYLQRRQDQPQQVVPRLARLTSRPSGNRFGSVPPNCEKASPKKNGPSSRSTERSNLTITSTDHPSGRLHEEGVCRRPIFRRTYQ